MKKYEAMVLSCIDPRFQPKVYKYLRSKNLVGKYSSFTIAGVGIGVTHKKFNSSIENKIHKESFKNIKIKIKKNYPNIKINFKILSI